MDKIVILSHQGGSFIGKLLRSATNLGLEAIIISSKAKTDIQLEYSDRTPYIRILSEPELSSTEVRNIIDSEFDIREIRGFISVWEGYRPLMAALNTHYGLNDISENKAFQIRDKLTVREKLAKAKLSKVKAEVADSETLGKRLENNTRSFIKPRFGLGSVGTKELRTESDIQYIHDVREKLGQDILLGRAVDATDFIVEDFIDGVEFSAEIIVTKGKPVVLAYHEKLELRYGLYTTTEPFCVSPPVTEFRIDEASEWLAQVMECLEATYGCYHVEFKVSREGIFELIELNPRVGGALIVESTNYIADTDILAWWMTSLDKCVEYPIALPRNAPLDLQEQDFVAKYPMRCTAFRVYFSNLCGTVDKISMNRRSPMPSIHNVLVKIGQKLSLDSSEQYLGQALWTGIVETKEQKLSFQHNVQNISEEFLRIDVRREDDTENVFILIDYNLGREDEVIEIAEKCFTSHGIRTVLVTERDKGIDHPLIVKALFDDVKTDELVRSCVQYLEREKFHCAAGLVFSDDAIVTGSRILSHLGVWTDSPELAVRSLNKMAYREAELEETLPEGVAGPRFKSVTQLDSSSFENCSSWILKPCCEGNNRGVVKITSTEELAAALELNEPYAKEGLLAEECVDILEEYSIDGVGSLQFVTKKLSLSGKYPVEVGQVQPATIESHRYEQIIRASEMANAITGQRRSAFHNEIMISRATGKAYVVEPNRRPGGMGIWKLIRNSYGVDLYDAFIQAAFTGSTQVSCYLKPKKRTGMLMLPGPAFYKVKHNELLSSVDKLVSWVWDEISADKQDVPCHSHAKPIAPEGFMYPEEPTNGHEYMLSLQFEASLDVDLEAQLMLFYNCWSFNILAYWSSQQAKTNLPETSFSENPTLGLSSC